MEDTKRKELEEARDCWNDLAEAELSMAAHLETIGKPYGSTDTYHVRANIYRRAAESLQIQIDTGVSVCSCCFKPFESNNVRYEKVSNA